VITNVESIKSEDEAERVMLEKELDRKIQMIEEHLQLQRVHQKESEEFAELNGAFTAGFEKIKKLTQDKLDRKTADIMMTDEEIEKFIDKTKKDFENFVKTLESKEV